MTPTEQLRTCVQQHYANISIVEVSHLSAHDGTRTSVRIVREDGTTIAAWTDALLTHEDVEHVLAQHWSRIALHRLGYHCSFVVWNSTPTGDA